MIVVVEVAVVVVVVVVVVVIVAVVLSSSSSSSSIKTGDHNPTSPYYHRHFPQYDPREYFHNLLIARGLERDRVADGDLDQDFWADDIEVWEIRRGGGGGGGGGSVLPVVAHP